MRKIKITKILVGNFFIYLTLALLLVLAFTDIKWILYVMTITACIGIVFKWVGEVFKNKKRAWSLRLIVQL